MLRQHINTPKSVEIRVQLFQRTMFKSLQPTHGDQQKQIAKGHPSTSGDLAKKERKKTKQQFKILLVWRFQKRLKKKIQLKTLKYAKRFHPDELKIKSFRYLSEAMSQLK